MHYAPVTGIALPVSRIVLGTMVIDTERYAASAALLDAAVAHGITCLDIARVYGGGKSEAGVGRWMEERRCRERMVVLTKGCLGGDRSRVSRQDMHDDIHASLAALRTTWIDLWMFHRDDERVPVEEIVEWAEEHRRAGRIRAYGGSNWRHERLAAANAYARAKGYQGMSGSQPNFGLCEQVQDPWGGNCITISGPQQQAARAWYQAQRLPVFAYSSLGRGLLSGRVRRATLAQDVAALDDAARKAYCHEVNYRRLDRCVELAAARGLTVPQVATAWLMAQPLQVHALVGAATPEEVAGIAAAADIRLTPQEEAYLDLRAEAPGTAPRGHAAR